MKLIPYVSDLSRHNRIDCLIFASRREYNAKLANFLITPELDYPSVIRHCNSVTWLKRIIQIPGFDYLKIFRIGVHDRDPFPPMISQYLEIVNQMQRINYWDLAMVAVEMNYYELFVIVLESQYIDTLKLIDYMEEKGNIELIERANKYLNRN